MILDERLRAEILVHAVENLYTRSNIATGGNLILAIEGPAGEGKTYHCKTVLGLAGVSIERFSLAEFESEAAGVPATRLIERYLRASAAHDGGHPTALVIEDIDLGLAPERGTAGAREIVQYTMNRDLLTGTLMTLCDSPLLVQVPPDSALPDAGTNRHCSRLPILLTGNNLDNVYKALVRHGRCRLVKWKPSNRMRLALMAETFPTLEPTHIRSLHESFPDEPVSFWTTVLQEIDSSRNRRLLTDLLNSTPDLRIDEIAQSFDTAPPLDHFDFDIVNDTAKEILATRMGELDDII